MNYLNIVVATTAFGSADDAKDEDSKIDPYIDPEPKSIVLLQRDCENTYTNSADTEFAVENNNGGSKLISSKVSISDESSENCCCGYSSNKRCKEHEAPEDSIKIDGKDKLKQDQINIKSINPLKPSSDYIMNTQNPKQKQNSPKAINATVCGYCGLKIKDSKSNQKKKEAYSPAASSSRSILIGSPGRNSSKSLFLSSIRNVRDQDANFVELNAPTPSPSASESSGSVYCTGDTTSQASAKSGNYRKSDGILSFYETLYESPTDPPLQNVEDSIIESNLFYGPVTFECANGHPLQPVKSDSCSSLMAFSQHLVLDIEHVIFDVLRTRY